jgi:hypothetical protein
VRPITAADLATLTERDVPSYCSSLEHLLRSCARPPFALERLSVIRGSKGRVTRVQYTLPRAKAANWGAFVQAHDDRDAIQASLDELPVIDIHSL